MNVTARRILRALKAVRFNVIDSLDWIRDQGEAARRNADSLRDERLSWHSSEVHDRISGTFGKDAHYEH